MSEPTPQQPDWDFAEYLRGQAAGFAHLSAHCAEHADRVSALTEQHREILDALDVHPVPELIRSFRRMAERTRLLSQIEAAQALAYDQMMAAGGPDDADAYADYAASTQRHIALLPDGDPGENLS
ncbi:MAG: hypothetical protein ACRDRN_06950 [Sciscionella sp.]